LITINIVVIYYTDIPYLYFCVLLGGGGGREGEVERGEGEVERGESNSFIMSKSLSV
jgi:hypothetical protein